MYEINFKDNEGFTGEYGAVMFVEGKATTDSDWIAAWFEGRGFNVQKKEEHEVNVSDLKLDELKVLCTQKGIEFDAKAKREELIKVLEGAE